MADSSLPVKEILDVIDTAKTATNEQVVSKKILDLYNNNLGSESAIYFSRDNNYKYIDLVKNNMDEKLNLDYKNYYHKFDPLDLLGKKKFYTSEIEIVKNIDYSGCEHSEYYTDFLSPQKIHYKLLISIKNGTEIIAKILLARSKKKGNFLQNDIAHAQEITPFIVQAIEIQKMKLEIQKNNNFHQMIEDNLKDGLILLDSSKRLILMNSKAREMCKLLRKDSFKIKNIDDINPLFLKDYISMLGEFESRKNNDLTLPKKRIIQDGTSTFIIKSKFVNKYSTSEKSNFFLIDINEISKRTDSGSLEVSSAYNLSKREVEVVNEVIKGYSNSTIALQLYISEVTVKKHLQNIFSKTAVCNRASLIQKILTGQGTEE